MQGYIASLFPLQATAILWIDEQPSILQFTEWEPRWREAIKVWNAKANESHDISYKVWVDHLSF